MKSEKFVCSMFLLSFFALDRTCTTTIDVELSFKQLTNRNVAIKLFIHSV